MPITVSAVPPTVDPAGLEFGLSPGAWLGPRLTPWMGSWTWTVAVPTETYLGEAPGIPGPFAVIGHRFGGWGVSASGSHLTFTPGSAIASGDAIADGATLSGTVDWDPVGADPDNTLSVGPFLELLIDRAGDVMWVSEGGPYTLPVSVQASPGYVGSYWGWTLDAYDSDWSHGSQGGFFVPPIYYVGSPTGTDTIDIRWDGTWPPDYVGIAPPGPTVDVNIATSLAATTVESNTATGSIWGYDGPPVGGESFDYRWRIDTDGDYSTTYTGRLVVSWSEVGDAETYPDSYPSGRWVLHLRVNYVPPAGGGIFHGHPIGAGFSGIVAVG